MKHPWLGLIIALANELAEARIPYSFEASTALLLQGLENPNMDDIDISVEWGQLSMARALFLAFDPTPITHHDGWAIFRFEREGVQVDILSYEGTIMATDPDRLAVNTGGQELWCKSMAFFHRRSAPGHPRRQLIEDFWAKRYLRQR